MSRHYVGCLYILSIHYMLLIEENSKYSTVLVISLSYLSRHENIW